MEARYSIPLLLCFRLSDVIATDNDGYQGANDRIVILRSFLALHAG